MTWRVGRFVPTCTTLLLASIFIESREPQHVACITVVDKCRYKRGSYSLRLRSCEDESGLRDRVTSTHKRKEEEALVPFARQSAGHIRLVCILNYLAFWRGCAATHHKHTHCDDARSYPKTTLFQARHTRVALIPCSTAPSLKVYIKKNSENN